MPAEHGVTILVIDDSAPVRHLIREALALEGYRVLEAADGDAGVRSYGDARPDLVLLDMILPGKGGAETLREILAIDPGAAVFTLSGEEGAGSDDEAAVTLGARRGFLKPFKMEDLLAAIREQISRRASRI